MSKQKQNVKKRSDAYVDKMATRICEEIPSDHNPYITKEMRLHGYDLLELMDKKSFIDVLLLLFKTELPAEKDRKLLEQLMIALINPGPRHPATRASIMAAIGKTDPIHLLPIGFSVLTGSHLGAGEIDEAMAFIRTNYKKDPQAVLNDLLEHQPTEEGDWHIAAGFGCRFGGIDELTNHIAQQLFKQTNSPIINWCHDFVALLKPHDMGWLITGVAAAVFTEVGLRPAAAVGLFQLFCAPGLLAHGLEVSSKPITAVPAISDENYVIKKK